MQVKWKIIFVTPGLDDANGNEEGRGSYIAGFSIFYVWEKEIEEKECFCRLGATKSVRTRDTSDVGGKLNEQ